MVACTEVTYNRKFSKIIVTPSLAGSLVEAGMNRLRELTYPSYMYRDYTPCAGQDVDIVSMSKGMNEMCEALLSL
jgi:hypothetical protein